MTTNKDDGKKDIIIDSMLHRFIDSIFVTPANQIMEFDVVDEDGKLVGTVMEYQCATCIAIRGILFGVILASLFWGALWILLPAAV